MNKTEFKKRINKFCLESGMTNAEFANKIYSAMTEAGSDLDLPAISTINRWYNGRIVPSESWYPFIAEGLGITIDELVGDYGVDYKNKIEDLSRQLETKEEEKALVERLVWLDGEGLIFLAVMLIECGSILANATCFKSGILFLVSIICLVVTGRFFDKRFPDYDIDKTLIDKTKSNIKFIRRIAELAKHKSILFGILSNYLFIVCLIAFLPLVESLFYKGTFYVSVVVYLLTAISMIVRGIYNH